MKLATLLLTATLLLAAAPCHAEEQYGLLRPATTTAASTSLISYMRQYVGTNPTGWSARWCGKFLDMALRATGHPGGGNLARGYARYGRRASGPCVGCLAVWSSHVGVVTGTDANGNVIIISGNDGHRVRERARSTAGVIAWRVP